MGLFLVYIIKSTICITLFYLFYKLLLSRDTFHRFNRLVLLSLMLLSLIIPFINIPAEETTVIQYPMLNLLQLSQIIEQPVQESSQTWILQLLMGMYIAGILFFVGRLIHSTYKIIRIIKSGEKIKLEKDIILIIIHRDIVPFSWMRYLVISSADWDNNRNSIITHEIAHISYHHSWDVFVYELFVVIHWFNPAAWFMKQELQNIHEFEADESVINQGIDAKKYQLLLIKKAVGTQRFNSMANSFNHSKLKKRITMMLKRKSNSWARLKYLFVLPLAAITIAAFARPEITYELDKISSTKISELPLIKETLPDKKESSASVKTSSGFVTNVHEDIPNKLEKLQKRQDKKDVSDHIDELTKRVNEKIAIEQAKLAKLQEELDKAMRESEANIQKFIEEEEKAMTVSLTNSMAMNDKVVIIIDGVEGTKEQIDRLKSENIRSINIQKNKELTEKYGKDLQGVIFIETKK